MSTIKDLMSSIGASSESIASLQLSQLAALSKYVYDNLDDLLRSRDNDSLAAAETILRHCESVASNGVFSSNEDADDVKTSDLSLLIVPFTLAELLSGCPSNAPLHRSRMVQSAMALYSRFLRHLSQYRIMGDLASSQYEQEEQQEYSGQSSTGASLGPTERRQAKIDRFKAEKAIKSKIEAIEARRKTSNATGKSQLQIDEEGDDGVTYSLGGPSGLTENDEREAWLLRIELCALRALEQRAMCAQEVGLLQSALNASNEAEAVPSEERDIRMRQNEAQCAKDEETRAKVMTGLNKVAAHLASIGSASGSGLGAMTQRERIMAGVFRPGHELPSMTVEEFGELELQQMKEREQRESDATAARRGTDAEGGDQGDFDDRAVEKQRAWDDWKDNNPKGHGNSALRPCGR